MSKEYFPHDYGARLSLRGIRKDFGLKGLGFYWCFVEILHEEGGYIKESDLDNIAYDLQVEPELCYAVTHNYDLFSVKKGKIFSERVLRNIKKRAEISAARKRAASERWSSPPPEEHEPERAERREAETTPEREPSLEEPSEEDDDFQKGVKFYYDCLERRTEIWLDEDAAEGGTSALFSSPADNVRQKIENLFDLIKGKKYQKINGVDVKTLDVMQAIIGFFRNKDTRWQLYMLLYEVDEKAEKGEIKNKQNYLVSTLYNAAKMSGA